MVKDSKENVKEQHFPEKYRKKLQTLAEGFMDTIDQLDTEEIKKRILTAEGNIYEIEYEKDNNEKFLKIKEEMQLISKPFAEAKTVETAKIKYCVYILTEKGVRI